MNKPRFNTSNFGTPTPPTPKPSLPPEPPKISNPTPELTLSEKMLSMAPEELLNLLDPNLGVEVSDIDNEPAEDITAEEQNIFDRAWSKVEPTMKGVATLMGIMLGEDKVKIQMKAFKDIFYASCWLKARMDEKQLDEDTMIRLTANVSVIDTAKETLEPWLTTKTVWYNYLRLNENS